MDPEEQPVFDSDEEETQKGASKKDVSAKPQAKQPANRMSTMHGSSFRDFQLRQEILRAIGEAGFEHPSEGLLRSATRGNSIHSLR